MSLNKGGQSKSAEGGHIRFVHSAKPTSDDWVEISIRDTAIGMNKETLKNLFKLVVNTSRKSTNNEPSTGLGLIICMEFIEKHGGKLWVESKEEKGSTFYFTLPAKTGTSNKPCANLN